MEEFKPDALIEHIKRLDRSLTHVWWGLSLLGIVAAALIGVIVVLVNTHSSTLNVPSPVSGRVSAREFIVTDENGDTVAWLGSLNGGTSGLILAANGLTPNEKMEPPPYIHDLGEAIKKHGGSYLTASSDQTQLMLADGQSSKKKEDSISLSVSSTSPGVYESALRLSGRNDMSAFSGVQGLGSDVPPNASFSLYAPKGKNNQDTELELEADGSSYLEFDNGLIDPRVRLEMDAQGIPSLNFFDKSHEPRAKFFLTATGDPLLSLWGKGEKKYRGTYLGDDGLTVADEQGKTRASLGTTSLENTHTGSTETTAAGSLTLFDKNGRVIWRVPQ